MNEADVPFCRLAGKKTSRRSNGGKMLFLVRAGGVYDDLGPYPIQENLDFVRTELVRGDGSVEEVVDSDLVREIYAGSALPDPAPNSAPESGP